MLRRWIGHLEGVVPDGARVAEAQTPAALQGDARGAADHRHGALEGPGALQRLRGVITNGLMVHSGTGGQPGACGAGRFAHVAAGAASLVGAGDGATTCGER